MVGVLRIKLELNLKGLNLELHVFQEEIVGGMCESRLVKLKRMGMESGNKREARGWAR